MRFTHSFLAFLAAGAAQAASWGFDEGKLVVTSAGKVESLNQKFSEKSLPKQAVALGATESLQVEVTVKEGGKAKRAHQAFLMLQDEVTGLEAPFPLSVKESGKATVEIKQADLPIQLMVSTKPLRASLIVASFGSSQGYNQPIFNLEVTRDPNAPAPSYKKPARYGKSEEINHIFRADPKNPPKIVSIVFVLAVLATVPALVGAWIIFGGNLAHLQTALDTAPVSHAVFFGSIVAMELVFFMYYSSWNLFQTLPVMIIVGVVTFLSGTKALGEVQSRRLAGER